MLHKIISGGQSGVDRAALDAAIKSNIYHGGWCPKGRKAEDGTIPKCYFLQETPSPDYNERTRRNIKDSDGTLILIPKLPVNVNDGTILTIEEVKLKYKPHKIVDLSAKQDYHDLSNWLEKHSIKVLNIAGPRESQSPGIYKKSILFLNKLFHTLACTVENEDTHTLQSKL